MNWTSLFVHAYVWANPITGYLAIANTFWSIGLTIMALVQHKDLDAYVANDDENGHDNWKLPLIIIFVLATTALATYFSPYVIAGGLGWSTFIIPVAFFGLELFIVNDYRKVLSNHVWKSAYWHVVFLGEFLVVITLISSAIFLVLSKVTQY